MLLLLSQALFLASAEAQPAADMIEAVTIHPPGAARFQCSDHALGAEDHVPDALAADCVVVRSDGGPNGNLLPLYTGDGTRNEDWHGWRERLLAPFDGVVLGIRINPESTVPGVRGSGRSSAIGFAQLVDGEPTDVHVGAFRGDMMSEDAVPLQVRMDLAAMGRLRGTTPNGRGPESSW
ncbi:hypothetical protein [Candidatus Palauibacter sp.]|uniref:hypothetical protein n=1 Tax=Candidatus Palauibacter sp. TaxID=3101350 RepID=UPI003AF2C3B1